ncbi:uncharacterized protein TrAFT101_000547 [Trichoderma asperellum]|uniref:DUF1772 domain-containing protein n=1 Tax=Trichoderma asperellum (strain ATCC 204424 / CBS 433.97 / NBRC 101777) TaxID=1042311 RepID=A0A2T3ZJT5_TRIA4|nr:hypothetical protein M441DRAFT_129563 [Trichoderma asperellum CBS 433.97]PTB45078.1 hypothetical protein M441DRAFT_129563 [Trichoderma asperellum CBS 433.97]UKZ84647.1 hypothetical protein TrAFT101_000547 [Trichoderma asperellum]
MQLSGPSLVAVATGVVGSAWLSGAIMSFSIGGAPAAAAVQQSSAKIWAELYKRGAASMPKFAVGTALAYFVAAYDAYGDGRAWGSYLGAAGLTLSIVPFTLTVMKKTNGLLHDEAKKDANENDISVARVNGLLDRWTTLNLIRGSLPLAGTILGLFTFLREAL